MVLVGEVKLINIRYYILLMLSYSRRSISKSLFGIVFVTVFHQILNIFFLPKLSAVCTFWIVLMCWCQKWFLKNEKTSLACISARKAIWKASATTLPNTLQVSSSRHDLEILYTSTKGDEDKSWLALAITIYILLLFSRFILYVFIYNINNKD